MNAGLLYQGEWKVRNEVAKSMLRMWSGESEFGSGGSTSSLFALVELSRCRLLNVAMRIILEVRFALFRTLSFFPSFTCQAEQYRGQMFVIFDRRLHL